MRKFILPLALGLAVVSCKKEAPVETTENKTETTTESPKLSLKEYTFEKVSELLNTKNDTLYVTNFFATWCGPCVKEIPHFKKVIDENKDKPVKFTFVSLDEKADWETKVLPFADTKGITANTVLLNFESLNEGFFSSNFKTWDGNFIPFTILRKGDKVEEISGGISKEILVKKMSSLN